MYAEYSAELASGNSEHKSECALLASKFYLYFNLLRRYYVCRAQISDGGELD
ncbi:hypothetical protein DAPPUDRAFT_279632 [Daphnia pulex]|uniref:Uncharacterized protein n=1 Tax=Daphnia pulex TaxID=6669 RepID=E9I7I0_DAPPU|nr:hypothetical protein DAPPUDRAFT_279632 [Daphnia pulex]|eukprot:EFX60050.1 hypothetical protein DAPPUDRAFT_279632 [Daphnia pulex]